MTRLGLSAGKFLRLRLSRSCDPQWEPCISHTPVALSACCLGEVMQHVEAILSDVQFQGPQRSLDAAMQAVEVVKPLLASLHRLLCEFACKQRTIHAYQLC